MQSSPVVLWQLALPDKRMRADTISTWAVRGSHGAAESVAWLRLQQMVFAPLGRRRPWGERDFHREILDRPDWDPQRLLVVDSPSAPTVWLGSLYLALPPASTRAQIRWLAVDPAWQQQGIGRALVDAACHLAQDWGRRHIEAETLATWTQACRFYERQQFVISHPS